MLRYQQSFISMESVSGAMPTIEFEDGTSTTITRDEWDAFADAAAMGAHDMTDDEKSDHAWSVIEAVRTQQKRSN